MKKAKKVVKAEDLLCDYSDTLIENIKEKPLTAVLIATGIGFILSKFLKK